MQPDSNKEVSGKVGPIHKIRRQLGWEPGILNAEGGKPKTCTGRHFYVY